VFDSVYRIAGSERTYAQALLAACLAIGSEAAVSHRAAATLHGLLTPTHPPVEVTTIRARSPELANVIVHRLADLRSLWVQDIAGVPCTTVARTLVDLGAVCRPWTVERALDRALGRRLVSLGEVRSALHTLARKGRRGVGILRASLNARDGGPPAGVLEARMATLVRRAGLPAPSPEYTVRDEHGGFLAVVDFAYPDVRLAIEVDGYESHIAHRTFRDDRTRQNLLIGARWIPLRFTWAEVDALSPHVADRIESELRRLRAHAA
jgi:hypothetical protein